MISVQEKALEVKEEPVMVLEEENEAGDSCFRVATLWDQLQEQG